MEDNAAAADRPLPPDAIGAIDAAVREAFPPARATEGARRAAPAWGARERHIVERLDGSRSYETIAAEWTDRGEQPMVAAQVKVFCDQLAEQGLVE